MSISIWVAAQKRLTEVDLGHIAIWNTCLSLKVDVPRKTVDHLASVLGDEAVKYKEIIPCIGDNTVEILVETDGEEMRTGGATFKLSDLPEGTVSIRVYSSS